MREARSLTGRLLLVAAVVAVLVGAVGPGARASSPSNGIALSLSSQGVVAAGLTATVPNGSALRYAMDGYFAPLVDSLPISNASKASILSAINASESNPLTAGLFGSRTGTVDAVDVERFQSLVISEAKLIPLSTFTGVLNVTLDASTPAGEVLEAIAFSNAEGPDRSSASIGTTATLSLTFVWSGVGKSHTFQIAWNLPSLLGNLSLPVSPVNLSFGTPDAITITSVSGLNATRISNDPFGWGPASVSGQYTPLPGHTVVIRFGPSFPTGDVLVGGAIAAAVILAVAFLLLRRRRRRRSTPVAPPPGTATETGVGPSSGSG